VEATVPYSGAFSAVDALDFRGGWIDIVAGGGRGCIAQGIGLGLLGSRFGEGRSGAFAGLVFFRGRGRSRGRGVAPARRFRVRVRVRVCGRIHGSRGLCSSV
jgi:hypothetical protein